MLQPIRGAAATSARQRPRRGSHLGAAATWARQLPRRGSYLGAFVDVRPAASSRGLAPGRWCAGGPTATHLDRGRASPLGVATFTSFAGETAAQQVGHDVSTKPRRVAYFSYLEGPGASCHATGWPLHRRSANQYRRGPWGAPTRRHARHRYRRPSHAAGVPACPSPRGPAPIACPDRTRWARR